MQPDVFRTVILVRLPLDMTNGRCECGGPVDNLGRHRAACPRSGRLRTRAVVPERTLARVCREAGAVVLRNVKLRDMNTTVLVNEGTTEPNWQWTLPCEAPSMPQARHVRVNGAVLHRARRDKETNAELVEGDRCRVVPIETGGRWGDEAIRFIDALASASFVSSYQVAAVRVLGLEATRMLAFSCSRAFAGSLTSNAEAMMEGVDGATPDLSDLFGQDYCRVVNFDFARKSGGPEGCGAQTSRFFFFPSLW